MANTLNDFINALNSGVQRNHLWQVTVSFPAQISDNQTDRNVQLLARTAHVPSETLGVIEISWQGRIIPLAGDRKFESFPINFLSTNDKSVRSAFERWSNIINGNESNTGVVNLGDYTSDITLELLDNDRNVTASYVLKDAWPVNVGQEELDMSQNDSHTQYPVEFRYIYFSSVNTR